MNQQEYTTNLGDYLIVWVDGDDRYFIAEVTKTNPLIVKIEEDGPYSKLKEERDILVLNNETTQFQKDIKENSNVFLETKTYKVFSGLKNLGVEDGKMHEMLLVPV